MTRSVFSERVIICLYNQPLIAPVLQHLLHAVLCHTGTLLDDALLHSLCEGELLIQPLIDRVVLAAPHPDVVLIARIVPAIDRILDAFPEEEEGVVHQRVGYHVVRLQHLRRLCLHQISHGDRCLGIPRCLTPRLLRPLSHYRRCGLCLWCQPEGCRQETLRLHPHARDISCRADQ